MTQLHPTPERDFTDEQLLLTTVQAARLLSVSRSTIYELMKTGQLQAIHLSRAVRISWAELERFVLRLEAANSEAPAVNAASRKMERRWRRTVTASGRPTMIAVEVPAPDGDPAA